MGRLDAMVGLVTGAASGIGRATARRLAAEGASVLAADLNRSGLRESCREIRAAGGSAESFALDVSRPRECRAAVAAALERFGRLDVLCNIAGIGLGGRVTDHTEAEWNRIVGVNLSSVFFMSQAAIPHLLATRGSIVNLSSTAGLVGQAYTSMYCATKAGVVALSRSMALEYAKQGMRVNCVCPGAVKTPLAKQFSLPEDADRALVDRLMPLVGFATPDEIAGAIAYLASPEARYVNGATLTIDGGQTAS